MPQAIYELFDLLFLIEPRHIQDYLFLTLTPPTISVQQCAGFEWQLSSSSLQIRLELDKQLLQRLVIVFAWTLEHRKGGRQWGWCRRVHLHLTLAEHLQDTLQLALQASLVLFHAGLDASDAGFKLPHPPTLSLQVVSDFCVGPFDARCPSLQHSQQIRLVDAAPCTFGFRRLFPFTAPGMACLQLDLSAASLPWTASPSRARFRSIVDQRCVDGFSFGAHTNQAGESSFGRCCC